MVENRPPQEKVAPQPQTIPETPPTPIKPNKTPIIMSVITVLSLLLSGYLAYQNIQLKNQFTQTDPIQSSTSSPTASSTSNWDTFEGKIFRYKYPPKMHLVDDNFNDSSSIYIDKDSATTSLNCIQNKLGTPAEPCESTIIIIIITKKDPKEFVLGSDMSDPIQGTTGSGISYLKESEAIGGLGLSTLLRINIENENNTFSIDLQTTPTGEAGTIFNNQEWEMLNQILSTFEFLDETADWETYTNNLLGINFRHPYTVYENTDLVQLSKSKEGGIVILTSNLIDSSNLALCDVEVEQTECLNVENNTDPSKRTEKVKIGGKDATSFYYWERQGNSILQVIEFANPNFQFLSFIDGVGLKETVGQILSTFEFID